MPTKIFTIGDPHFKVSNRTEMGIFTERCIEAIKERAPDFIVVMGDVLDRHENIHVHALMDANEFLIALSRITKTYVLIGNHDRPNNSNYLTDEHPFTSLKEFPNLTIVDNVVREGEWLFVPYVPPGRFHEAIDGIPVTELTAIFAHQEFKGCSYKNIVSTSGDVWPNSYPTVISGHIHQYQQPQDNIIYVGTPLQHNFGDADDCTVSFFEFDANEMSEERIYLDVPKKIVVKLPHDQVKEWLSSDQATTPNVAIKLVVTGPNDKLQALSKSGVLKGASVNTKISLVSDHSDIDAPDPLGEPAGETVNFRQILMQFIHDDAESSKLEATLNNILGIPFSRGDAGQPIKKKKIVFAAK